MLLFGRTHPIGSVGGSCAGRGGAIGLSLLLLKLAGAFGGAGGAGSAGGAVGG